MKMKKVLLQDDSLTRRTERGQRIETYCDLCAQWKLDPFNKDDAIKLETMVAASGGKTVSIAKKQALAIADSLPPQAKFRFAFPYERSTKLHENVQSQRLEQSMDVTDLDAREKARESFACITGAAAEEQRNSANEAAANSKLRTPKKKSSKPSEKPSAEKKTKNARGDEA